MANVTYNVTTESRKMGPTEEKLYLGLGLGASLLVIAVFIVIVIASIYRSRRGKKGRPRTGRFVSVANSDFETYNAINPSVFNKPERNRNWNHRQLPSSPTPTITTISNGFFSDGHAAHDYGPMSMKIMDQMINHKACLN